MADNVGYSREDWQKHYDEDDLRWDFAIQQPVIRPIGESRNWIEVLWDLAHRAGISEDLYSVINISLQLKPGLKLEKGKRYTFREFADAWIKSWCGTEFGLDYFDLYHDFNLYCYKESL